MASEPGIDVLLVTCIAKDGILSSRLPSKIHMTEGSPVPGEGHLAPWRFQ